MRTKFFRAAFAVTTLCTLHGTIVWGHDAIQRFTEDQVKIVKKPAPTYPAIARQMNMSGKVAIDLTVADDGSVEKAEPVTGSPILAAAAVDAGKRWKFEPIKTDPGARAVVRVMFNFAVSH